MPYTILIANADDVHRAFIAEQLDADGHTVYEADSPESTIAKLSTQAVDVVVLSGLERPADSPALLRAIRADKHTRIHPAQPVITLGADDEISTLRAYEAGSDHHLPDNTGYFVLRAVLLSVARRALEDVARRTIEIGNLHIDTAAKTALYKGQPIRLSRLEFEVLQTMANDPSKVFSRHELARTVWGHTNLSGRTVESHLCRLRHRLSDVGATHLIANSWGHGWALLDPMRPRQED